ncbi:hypothetical protein PAPHI01_0423 [Pancytospora philotis]|nr:hypothetical protein PAPHI01_0423 [Pancytospora philotis]
MEDYLVAIGDAEKIEQAIQPRMHTQEGDVVVISATADEHPALIKELSGIDGVTVCPYAQLIKTIGTQLRSAPFKAYDSSTVYDWQKTGNEFFGLVYSGSFEVLSVNRASVNSTNKVEPVSNGTMSSTGAVLGFIRGNTVSLHVNDTLDKIFDIKIAETATKLSFDSSDRFVAISGPAFCYIYNVLTGALLHRADSADVCFARGCAYFRNGKFDLNTGAFEETEPAEVLQARGDSLAFFLNGKLQQIVFDTPKGVQSKNHNGITEIEFYFAESRLYALITKSINGEDQYIVESYTNSDITMNTLSGKPYSLAVSDNAFVVCDAKNNLAFYQKERYNFALAKKIRKEGPSIAALKSGVACVYDRGSQTIEFYDKLQLRAVYTHPGCTEIRWSESGLYVAAYAISAAPSAMVQVFDCNAKLVYRKTYNQLRSFQWRGYKQLTAEQIAAIGPVPEDFLVEQADDAEFDVTTLLSEWKSYLLAKIQNRKNK